jgi:hypothetical protein
MSDLFDYFEEMSGKIKEVQIDINATIVKLQKEGNDNKDKKDKKEGKDNRIISSNAIEPVTRLRSSVNEVNSAKENPEIQFIQDRIEDIFK